MAEQPITRVFGEMGNLAYLMGARSIKDMLGCWNARIDEAWEVSVNGHGVPTKNDKGAEVPPYSMLFYFNGWPAGVVDAGGGVVAGGEVAHEDELLRAIRAKAGSLPQPQEASDGSE